VVRAGLLVGKTWRILHFKLPGPNVWSDASIPSEHYRERSRRLPKSS
jgi:hypothetical protein